MYKRKSRGPKTEQCGTPSLNLDQFETLLLFSLSLYIAFCNICCINKSDTVEDPCYQFHKISI
jgi:hypothetical protein